MTPNQSWEERKGRNEKREIYEIHTLTNVRCICILTNTLKLIFSFQKKIKAFFLKEAMGSFKASSYSLLCIPSEKINSKSQKTSLLQCTTRLRRVSFNPFCKSNDFKVFSFCKNKYFYYYKFLLTEQTTTEFIKFLIFPKMIKKGKSIFNLFIEFCMWNFLD